MENKYIKQIIEKIEKLHEIDKEKKTTVFDLLSLISKLDVNKTFDFQTDKKDIVLKIEFLNGEINILSAEKNENEKFYEFTKLV